MQFITYAVTYSSHSRTGLPVWVHFYQNAFNSDHKESYYFEIA